MLIVMTTMMSTPGLLILMMIMIMTTMIMTAMTLEAAAAYPKHQAGDHHTGMHAAVVVEAQTAKHSAAIQAAGSGHSPGCSIGYCELRHAHSTVRTITTGGASSDNQFFTCQHVTQDNHCSGEITV